jgi:hemerythrin superfamily protein
MNSKLTLSIEEEIIQKAKKYARNKGQSLSQIVENYLKAIADKNLKSEEDITPLVKSLKGTFTAPEESNYKKELTKRLSDKYR